MESFEGNIVESTEKNWEAPVEKYMQAVKDLAQMSIEIQNMPMDRKEQEEAMRKLGEMSYSDVVNIQKMFEFIKEETGKLHDKDEKSQTEVQI